jgi:hypothetical protein
MHCSGVNYCVLTCSFGWRHFFHVIRAFGPRAFDVGMPPQVTNALKLIISLINATSFHKTSKHVKKAICDYFYYRDKIASQQDKITREAIISIKPADDESQ